mgnify:CR=1 FL=1|tara:strand:+ start:407 stop:1819 length:1413 start_codon:yes stop_codon:yes gene_type:complete
MDQSPYTPLHNLKGSILGKLKTYLATTQATKNIHTLSITFEAINLVQLLPFIDHSQKILFCDREGSKQYLGIKFLRSFTSSFSISQAKQLIKENPKLIALGGQRFHQNTKPAPEWVEIGNQFYTISQFTFSTNFKETTLHINIDNEYFENATLASKLILDLDSLLSFKGHSQKSSQLTLEEEIPNKTQWFDQVNKAKAAFDNGSLEKVVLSRKSIFKSPSALKPDDLFESMKLKVGENFIFHMQWRRDRSFTSMTPERLFKLEDSQIFSDAIAGTRPRGKDRDTDESLANELKSSTKELNEHRFVSKSVLATLKSLGCLNAKIDGDPEQVLKLKHVQHLYTKLSGHIPGLKNISDLIEAFHPTPAVGGTPKQAALDWLVENESYDRGLYASPVGVITANGADFCVAIRSALVFENKLHVFAGAGIVAESDANQEWDETTSKMKNFTLAFNDKDHDLKSRKETIDEQHSSH